MTCDILFVGENMRNYCMGVYRGIFSNDPIFVLHMKPKSPAATDLAANNTSLVNEIVKKKVAKSICMKIEFLFVGLISMIYIEFLRKCYSRLNPW